MFMSFKGGVQFCVRPNMAFSQTFGLIVDRLSVVNG